MPPVGRADFHQPQRSEVEKGRSPQQWPNPTLRRVFIIVGAIRLKRDLGAVGLGGDEVAVVVARVAAGGDVGAAALLDGDGN